MTASRRIAPLPLLLMALLALGGVLLWSAPAEAQTTSRLLVSNDARLDDDSVETSGNAHAQLFHTGNASNGYTLTSVTVDSEDTGSDDFNVEICAVDDDGFPISVCTELTRPASFAAGDLRFTHPGLFLKSNTNYTIVIIQDGSESVTLDSTTSGGEDPGSLSGWSIRDKFDVKTSGTWQHKSGTNEAIRITVNGYATTQNTPPTGRPVVLAAAQGAGILFADTERIADANGIPIDSSGTFSVFNWNYQWVRVDGNTRTNVGANSATYQPVAADVGKKIMVRVSYTDGGNFANSVTSLPFGPIVEPDPLPATKLVSNTGQSSATADITQQYAVGFRLGDHGQGYEISSVSIDLAARPSRLSVSLWSGGRDGIDVDDQATKLFDFANPSSFKAGMNTFTAPAGAFAYQKVNYFIVLSGFGSKLSIKETSSDNEDTGTETGAIIYDKAAVRGLNATGLWKTSGSRDNVLRLSVEGSRRAGGILAATYAQPIIDDKGTTDTSDDVGNYQEIISLGDNGAYGGIQLGAADRYLIRGVSFGMDSTTGSGGFSNPLDLRSGSRTGALQFSLTNSRHAVGLPVWTAPQGATVTGSAKYVFDQLIGEDDGPERTRRRDAILGRLHGAGVDGEDAPKAPGVTITGPTVDISLDADNTYMAVLGEPLVAMVQNLGQTDNGFAEIGGANAKVVSQEFRTGTNEFGYRLQGFGVELEGSDGMVPDNPTSVSASVYAADFAGKPDRKLFDLVSPTDFAAGHVFFEAPPDTHLAPTRNIVLVWRYNRGALHRLHRTTDNGEDSGAATGSVVANSYYLGADVNNLTEDSNGNALQVAVYAEANTEAPFTIVVPEPEPEDTSVGGVTGGGPGHFGGDARVTCSAPPAEHCPTYDTVAGGQRTIWSATMTVGREPRPGSIVFGYGNFQDPILLTYTPFGTLDDKTFTSNSTQYAIENVLKIDTVLKIDLTTALGADANNLTLHVGTQQFAFADATYSSVDQSYLWRNAPSLSVGDSVALKITGPPLPNLYGYRTIWNAVLTAGTLTSVTGAIGFEAGTVGGLTNDLMVIGRDESITIGTADQPRYPWTGYRIDAVYDSGTTMIVEFDSNVYPSADEASGWTLDLGGGVTLPFADAEDNPSIPQAWLFRHDPGWSAGDQAKVSIRTGDVQNRFGRVYFQSKLGYYGKNHYAYNIGNRLTSNRPAGDGKFGRGFIWELRHLSVQTDGTADTDEVGIVATFRALSDRAAERAWQGYWEGEFDDFHTLFLRWIHHEGGVGKGEATYTLPLKAANGFSYRAKYDGRPDNFYVVGGHEVTFTWVITYKEFQDKHLDLANHSSMSAHMLTTPQPATARAGGVDDGGGDNLARVYTPPIPPAVASVELTSDPGSDQVYGPGSTIQVTVAFSEDVTVEYRGSKRHAAEVDLHFDTGTRTAYYARTEGNRVILEYTVVPGDESDALHIKPNSLRLAERVTDTQIESKNYIRDSWIRDSDGQDALLDHSGILSTLHRVDAVAPEFASAQVSADGAQVAVTFDESIRTPAILRAFGVQTSLLQSLALDVRVDGEVAALTDAALSGDTVTLMVEQPITQGQTVTVSHDNLFVTKGETIFKDLHGNKLGVFSNQPVTNNSTVTDANTAGGGLALSRTEFELNEGRTGTYTVALTSEPTSGVDVAIAVHPSGHATVTPDTLSFTTDNWNTPQTVTITSAEDVNYFGRYALLRHTASGDGYAASAVAWLMLQDGYNATTATPNTRATGAPTIDGTPKVGQTLTVDASGISDANGLEHVFYTYFYQWIRDRAEIAGQTGTTYTLTDADEGKTIKVKVSFTDDAHYAESRISAPTEAVGPPPNTPATGEPAINGTAQVKHTLTVDTSAIDDVDGMEDAVFGYRWFLTHGLVTSELAGETGPTLKLVPNHEGYTFHVEVSFTDDRGNSETLTSAATEAVAAAEPNSAPTGLPAISGTPQVGETLTADTSAIDDPDGLTNVEYRYQWISSQTVIDENTGISNIVAIELPGATGSTYQLGPSDEGFTFKVKVSFTDDADNEETLTSEATVAVAPPPNAEPTGLPAVTGTPQVGQTLTADTSAIDDEDGLDDAVFEYQWLRNQSVLDENAGTYYYINVEVQGATGSTYDLAPADKGHTFAVRVSYEDDRGNSESLTSANTVIVAARPNSEPTGLPTIDGTPQVGQTLTAATSAIDDEDGLENAVFRYQWIASKSDVILALLGETSSTYTLAPTDEGYTLQVRVTFTDDADNQESLTSEATVAVAAAAPAPLTAAFQDLPDSHDGSTAFTFRVLFSEDVGISYVNMRDDAFSLSEGDVTGARRVEGRNDLWEITVEPDGDDGVAVTLTGNRACATTGAICTREDSPRQLTNSPTATVKGPAEAPPTNTSAAGAPTISGTPQVDQTLTASTSAINDQDGLTNVSYEYQWLAGGTDISGATGSSYTLTYSEQGQTVQVRVTFTDDADNEETLTSVATVAVAAAPNREATGKPGIGGTPQVEETLTADTSPIDDADGLGNVSYSYQWLAGGTDIAGATGSTYELTSSEQGKTIQVRVTFTDDRGNSESLTSEATVAVAAKPIPLTATFSNVPASHSGSGTTFTFDLAFSENFPLSYITLRDHAFSEDDDGPVIGAQRKVQGSNQTWTITVEPKGNGAITVTLPATTDCNDSGAICTGDGRKLSHSLSFTVSGPGGLGAAGCRQHCRPHTRMSGRAHRPARTGALACPGAVEAAASRASRHRAAPTAARTGRSRR